MSMRVNSLNLLSYHDSRYIGKSHLEPYAHFSGTRFLSYWKVEGGRANHVLDEYSKGNIWQVGGTSCVLQMLLVV